MTAVSHYPTIIIVAQQVTSLLSPWLFPDIGCKGPDVYLAPFAELLLTFITGFYYRHQLFFSSGILF